MDPFLIPEIPGIVKAPYNMAGRGQATGRLDMEIGVMPDRNFGPMALAGCGLFGRKRISSEVAAREQIFAARFCPGPFAWRSGPLH
ncbi:hypothetical protein HMSSN036_45110 [Paenibacillus macerans]|nr:hypothetical protein HMSSN036_45110 [Paenibacillus macerans]